MSILTQCITHSYHYVIETRACANYLDTSIDDTDKLCPVPECPSQYVGIGITC